MSSIDHAGKAGDETCCRVSAPEHMCRCHLSERLWQMDRIKARIPGHSPTFSRDEVAEMLWRERLTFLAALVMESDGEPHDSPVYAYRDRVADQICDIRSGDSTRETPFTASELKRARWINGLRAYPTEPPKVV